MNDFASTGTFGNDAASRLRKLWEQGPPPELVRFLAECGKLTPETLLQILRMDQQCRLERGIVAPVESYLERFPAIRSDVERFVEFVYSEFLHREKLGQSPGLEEYTQRFPDIAERLGMQIELHQALAAADEQQQTEGFSEAEETLPARRSNLPTLPGFELLETLGRGGMGVVYKAHQLGLGRVVAVKMILDSTVEEERSRSRFRSEAEAAARLHHPHIIHVYQVGEEQGRPFLVMEYVEGGTLSSRLSGQPIEPVEAAILVRTLAAAVEHAHSEQVIHRDLKPANVLMSGGRGKSDSTAADLRYPKIADFGLARRLDSGSIETRTGTAVGTPSYMAPEQAEGRTREIGKPADIYALGAILYECLTGRPPFRAADAVSTLHQVIYDEPVSPRRLNQAVPRDLETICLKCLAKEPARRYASAGDLGLDLGRFLEGKPILARPSSAWERSWKWARRRPAVAGLLAAVVLIAVAGFTLVTREWLRADAEADRARRAESIAVQKAADEAAAAAREAVAHQKELAAHRNEEAARLEAQRTSTLLALDQGLGLCRSGEVGRGLLYFARALELAPAQATDLRRVIRLNATTWEQGARRLRLCLDHGGPLTAAAIDPAGTIIFSAGNDSIVRLWDAVSGDPIDLLTHDGQVRALALSRNGDVLVCGVQRGDSHEVVVWDVRSRKARPPIAVSSTINAVAVNGNGRVFVAGCNDGRAWAWIDGVLKELPHDGQVRAVAVNQTGTRALTSYQGQHEVFHWSLPDGQPVGGPARGAPETPRALAFTPDGRWYLTGTDRQYRGDGVAVIYLTEKEPLIGDGRKQVRALHPEAVTSIAFRDDGRLAATGCEDGGVRFWNTDGPVLEPAAQPFLQTSGVRSVEFAQKGNALLVGCADGTIRLWEIPRTLGSTTSPFEWQPSPLYPEQWFDLPFEFVPFATVLDNGSRYAVVYAPPLQGSPEAEWKKWGYGSVWERESGKEPGPRLKMPTHALARNPDGTELVIAGDQFVSVWNPITGALRPLGSNFKARFEMVAWASRTDGVERIAAGTNRGIIHLFDPKSGAVEKTITLKPFLNGITFSPDGQLLAAASSDRGVHLLDPITGKERHAGAFTHHGPVYAIAFQSGTPYFFSGGGDGVVRKWNAETGMAVGDILPLGRTVRRMAISPNGMYLAVSSGNRFDSASVTLWDTATGRPIGAPYPLPDSATSLEFTRDGTLLLIASRGTARRSALLPAASGVPTRIEFCSLPQDIADDLAVQRLRAEYISGLELSSGEYRPIPAETWRKHAQQLKALGQFPEVRPTPKRDRP